VNQAITDPREQQETPKSQQGSLLGQVNRRFLALLLFPWVGERP